MVMRGVGRWGEVADAVEVFSRSGRRERGEVSKREVKLTSDGGRGGGGTEARGAGCRTETVSVSAFDAAQTDASHLGGTTVTGSLL